MEPVVSVLFNFLRDVIYDPAKAVLDIDTLPEEYQDFGSGLQYFAECVIEAKELAQALSKGKLDIDVPPPDNEIAAPLKSLHASLKHLTWQAQQIALGDYQQRVSFMGDFAVAFNSMAQQLEERRKLDTQERTKLQQYINLILSNTPNILLAFDLEGKTVLASKSYIRKIKKYSMVEIQGKTFADLFACLTTEEFIQKVDNLIANVRKNKNIKKFEYELDFGQDGTPRTYLIHIAPMLYDNNDVMGTIVVFDDMTEIIQAQRESERALELTKQAQYEAEQARKIAEQSSRVKTEFLARMSHEMRTPMNAIIGMAVIGKKNADNERTNRCFDKINEASRHLINIIDDLFDISIIESDKLELSYDEFILEDVLKRVARDIKIQAMEKKQAFTVDINSNIPLSVISDEKRLAQVITNLLSNAIKFTPEHGSILLAVTKITETDGICTIRFTVKDTGIGLSKEQQKLLFKPFEQGEGGFARKFGGTGLGLSISKHIVEMMGGNIWVESEPGMGASFIFEVKMQIKIKSASNVEEVPLNGIFAGKNILIVEDVEINREIIASLFEDTGAELSFAFDGVEAVDKFLSAPTKYDLILMDLQMPVMDGFEATKRIRSSGLPEGVNIPIIAMTANVLTEDVERCLAAGMNGHLGKPIDMYVVITTLMDYLC